ncbi:hypothetical protein DRO57_01620 [Candidatus Bathyarchaeota archaeon]|nr:MAG: hypothetical protein DRO57_01620 [Candidatus Bathyarchaeota archaeon]
MITGFPLLGTPYQAHMLLQVGRYDIGDVVVGEGSGLAGTFRAFQVAGVDAVAERWGVGLVDLNRDEFIEVELRDPLALKRVRVAKTALERAIISVPKLKPHSLARVTLSLKNMMGFFPERSYAQSPEREDSRPSLLCHSTEQRYSRRRGPYGIS